MFVYCARIFFFFNDTATTEIYTLSLHDALPILREVVGSYAGAARERGIELRAEVSPDLGMVWTDRHKLSQDRKSTRLNSSHANISYAVFCLKKKNNPSRY